MGQSMTTTFQSISKNENKIKNYNNLIVTHHVSDAYTQSKTDKLVLLNFKYSRGLVKFWRYQYTFIAKIEFVLASFLLNE